MTTRILPYVWYPLVFASSVAGFAFLLSLDFPTPVAAYIPITLAAIAIILLEVLFPDRVEWRPRLPDIKADAAFMAVVQVIFPRALAMLAILAIAAWANTHMQSRWWPHEWPLAAQVAVIVLIVDFTRYWLHRACHRYLFLWRFHEVHHSPEILYTLNVGRFHPVEKILHFSLDSLPFLLIGVDPRALAGYFLLYSVNGFFQHSNVRLRYGWLNYFVGSAETHRWHHARDPKTASCNFGNTTIVWDLVFGTWHLPQDQAVEDIGIPDREYPKQFLQQMLMPFRRRGRASHGFFKARLAGTLMSLYLRLARLLAAWRIRKWTKDPMRTQRALLSRILADNRNTTFGKQHGFDRINDYAAFAQRVPVRDYEALRPFVEAEILQGTASLTAQKPLRYLRTSGSTGLAKDIPVTPYHLSRLRRIHHMAVAFQHRVCSGAFDGAILAIVSPADEDVLANGKPVGSASGIVAGSTPALIQEKFVVPRSVLALTNSHLKYLLILRLALDRPDITYLGTANPSTLLTLMQLYREHESELIEDVRRGTFFLCAHVPREMQAILSKRLCPQPVRAAELARLATQQRANRIADLWPALRLVVTWTCASAGVALDALRKELAPSTRIMELGYLSSEFRGTITLGRHSGSGFPTLDTHFFEFVEREKWDSGQPEYLTLDRLRKGGEYYILVTTPSGLYRYFINDLIRVRGFLHNAPLLQFVQKGKGVTSITGEKLYESQVLAAVGATMSDAGCSARFIMMLADEISRTYRLYVEGEANAGARPAARTLAELVDTRLRESNIEYLTKRESGRLGPLSAAWLRSGTYDAYKAHCVKRGQREGQFKVLALAYGKDVDFNLELHTESTPHDSDIDPSLATCHTVQDGL